MKQYCRSIMFVFALFAYLLVACQPGGSKELSYPEANLFSINDTDRIAFVGDFFGIEALLYESKTNLSWTMDTGSKIRNYFDKSLPDSGWRLDADWAGYGLYYSTWEKSDQRIIIAYTDNLTQDQIGDLNRKYGISVSDPEAVLIVTHLWDTTQPLPTLTSTNTPIPTATPIPSNTPIPSITPKPTLTFTPRPTNTPLPTPTSTPTDIATEMQIPFVSSSNLTSLADGWRWFPGSSESSNYRLSETGALKIIAGPGTGLWGGTNTAPQVEYSLSGNFEVQVKVDFNPTERDHIAGIGLRSSENPNTWIALRRANYWDQRVDILRVQDGQNQEITHIAYGKTTIYLRIKRLDEQLSFAVSENGTNWINIKTDYTFVLPHDVQAFLFVLSTTSNGTLAEFSDLRVRPPQEQLALVPNGPLSFTDMSVPDSLSPDWGWFPGISEASSYRIEPGTGNLTIVAGPHTQLWGSDNTAPQVMYGTSGKFDVQVKVDFNPTERDHVAGIGIRSTENFATWFVGRRAYYWDQRADVIQSLEGNVQDFYHIPYADTSIYLRITRDDPLISCYYSADGTNWTPMAKDYVMSFPDKVYIVLFVNSTTDHGVSATFSELNISRP